MQGGGEAAAAAAAAEGGEGGSEAVALPLAPAEHPLLAQLTPAFLDAMVALLLAVQPRALKDATLSFGKVCVAAALEGQFDGALHVLEAERRNREERSAAM